MLQQRGRIGLLQSCWLVGLLALTAQAFTAVNRTKAKSNDGNVGVTYINVAEYIANSDDDPDAGILSAIVPEDEVDDFIENATLQAGTWAAANREEADKAMEEALAIEAEYNEMIISQTGDDGFLTLNREVLALSRKYTAAMKKAAEFHPHLKEAAEEEERQTASFEEMLKVKTEKMNTSIFFSEDNMVAAAKRLSMSMGSLDDLCSKKRLDESEDSEIEKTETLNAAHAALAEFNAMDRPHDLSSREEWAAAFHRCTSKSVAALKLFPVETFPDHLVQAVREVVIRDALFQEYLPIEAKLRAIEENPDAYSQEQIAALTRRRVNLEWESMQEDCYIPEWSEDDGNPEWTIQIVGRKNYANFLMEKGQRKEDIDEMLAEFDPPGLRVETFGVVGSAEEFEEYKAKYHAFHVERKKNWRKILLAIVKEIKGMKLSYEEELALVEEGNAAIEQALAMRDEIDEIDKNDYVMSDQEFSDTMRRYAMLLTKVYGKEIYQGPGPLIRFLDEMRSGIYAIRARSPQDSSEYITALKALKLSTFEMLLGALGNDDYELEDSLSATSLINHVFGMDSEMEAADETEKLSDSDLQARNALVQQWVEIDHERVSMNRHLDAFSQGEISDLIQRSAILFGRLGEFYPELQTATFVLQKQGSQVKRISMDRHGLEGLSVSEIQARDLHIQDLAAIDDKKEAINIQFDAFSQEEIVDVMRRSATIFQNLGEFYPELKTAAFVLRETDDGRKELVVDYNATSEGKFDEAIAIAKMKTKRQHSRWLPRWFRPSKKAIVPILRVAALYTVLYLLLRI